MAIICPDVDLACPAGETKIVDYKSDCCGAQSCILATKPTGATGPCPLFRLACPAGQTLIFNYLSDPQCGAQSCVQETPCAAD